VKAKITRPDGTILELEDVTAMDLLALGFGNSFTPITVTSPALPTVDLCVHEYPSPWLGVVPPTCQKCGQQAPSYAPTYGVTLLRDASQ